MPKLFDTINKVSVRQPTFHEERTRDGAEGERLRTSTGAAARTSPGVAADSRSGSRNGFRVSGGGACEAPGRRSRVPARLTDGDAGDHEDALTDVTFEMLIHVLP